MASVRWPRALCHSLCGALGFRLICHGQSPSIILLLGLRAISVLLIGSLRVVYFPPLPVTRTSPASYPRTRRPGSYCPTPPSNSWARDSVDLLCQPDNETPAHWQHTDSAACLFPARPRRRSGQAAGVRAGGTLSAKRGPTVVDRVFIIRIVGIQPKARPIWCWLFTHWCAWPAPWPAPAPAAASPPESR